MILKFFNIGEIFTELCCGVYTTVAKAYNLMLSFTNGKAFNVSVINDTITSITDTIYVLVAVFMLFRITITMFEYLIDPDRVADKQTGAGKMITRVIISFILIMTFKSLIVPKLDELQNALLAEDSILSRLVDVNAETYSQAECREQINKARGMTASNGMSGENANNRKGGMAELIQGCMYYSGIIDDIENSSAYKNGSGTKKIICQMNGKVTSCDAIPNNYCVLKGDWYSNKNGSQLKFTINFTDDIEKCSRTDDLLTGGYTYEQIELGTSDASNTEGSKFAREIMATFTSQPDKLLETSFIDDPKGNEDFGKLVEQKEIDFDLFICIIVGIALIAIILVLCIEVIIRTFKLLLLQILAPIAFISYINPNDKVLNNWFQKYVGCYLDLFIKILSIRLAILFISKFSTQVSGLSALLVYIAIFIFAKTIPNIITDILGIKNMGGTFKESMNALKTAALVGTGALATGGIGFIAGMGKGGNFGTAVGGLLGGMVRGGNAGARGFSNIAGAVSGQRNRAVSARQRNAQGGSFWGQFASGFAHTFGHQDAYDKAEEQYKAADDALKAGSSFEDYAIGEARKNGDLFGLGKLEQAQSILNNGGQISSDISYVDKDGKQQILRVTDANGAEGIDNVNKALADAKKGAVQQVATALQNDGKFKLDGNTVEIASLTKAGHIDAEKAEKGQKILNTADGLFKAAGVEGYSDDISTVKGKMETAQAAAKDKMEKTRANHNATNNNR